MESRWLEVTLRALLLACVFVVVLASGFTVGFGAQWFGSGSGGLSGVTQAVVHPAAAEPPEFDVFWEVWGHVEDRFYGQLPTEEELSHGAIRGMLEAVDDPYTYFIEPSDHQMEEAQLEGLHGGIGADYVMANGYLEVVAVLEGSPAERANLRTGDVIIAVDGTEVFGLSQSEAILLIRGKEVGTEAVLTVVREGEPQPLSVRAAREEVEVPTVAWDVREAGVGYLRVSFFGARTSAEVIDALSELKAQDVTRLVLDLRDNPGGMVTAAVDVAGQFIDTGVIFYERDKSGNDKLFSTGPGGAGLNLPLAVLINRGTASAAEIVGGAIQDHERGVLIGETTFGKGSLQSIHELSDNSGVHVTIAHWLTPDHHEIEGAGLTPDVEVTPSADALTQGEDPQLEAALHYLASAVAETRSTQLCQSVDRRGLLCDA